MSVLRRYPDPYCANCGAPRIRFHWVLHTTFGRLGPPNTLGRREVEPRCMVDCDGTYKPFAEGEA